MASLLRLNTAIPLLTLTGLYFQWRFVHHSLDASEREGLNGNVADLGPSPSLFLFSLYSTIKNLVHKELPFVPGEVSTGVLTLVCFGLVLQA